MSFEMKKKFLLIFFIFLIAFSPYLMHKASRKIEKIRRQLCVDKHGFWRDKHAKHFFDNKLAEAILEFLREEKAQTLVDFGCGAHGHYVKFFLDHNIICEGFDGNPYSPKISKGLVKVIDLSQPFDLGKKYDWVMSVEVAEHIPKEFERTLLENLDRHNVNGIILTWAVEGQKGIGHFNCRNNDYVKKVFLKMGYVNDLEAEEKIRKKAHYGWFKNSFMVFRKKEKSFL